MASVAVLMPPAKNPEPDKKTSEQEKRRGKQMPKLKVGESWVFHFLPAYDIRKRRSPNSVEGSSKSTPGVNATCCSGNNAIVQILGQKDSQSQLLAQRIKNKRRTYLPIELSTWPLNQSQAQHSPPLDRHTHKIPHLLAQCSSRDRVLEVWSALPR